ncbi:MAG: beta-propeller domain-containing protein [Thaumarchaeota archaeon]|nr:beta-propeller domain-containing protein [Nitrososphaerota archaeon]
MSNPQNRGPIFMEKGSLVQAAPQATAEYSETNVQVAGVDEADILKTDGKYIYLASGNKFLIVNAYPADQMKILSNSSVEGGIRGVFIGQDRLVLFEENSFFRKEPPIGRNVMIAPYASGFHIKVYDTAQKNSPRLIRDISMNGTYINSRMIDSWIYIVASQSAVKYTQDKYEIVLPTIDSDGKTEKVPVNEIQYSDNGDISSAYTMIIAVNIQDETAEPAMKVMLTGFATTLYVSQRNIYVVLPDGGSWTNEGKTVIHRVSINRGTIKIEATGKVQGRILNQYSMDEFENHLRIATTTSTFSREKSATFSNNVYILNQQLETVGTLEDLAPGEQIYSARFMGAKGYLVTFKKVDPLFALDLSNPQAPKVLGKLKIPGYSNYLHPFDENHLIGIGKDAVESKQGDFALYQGVKVSLFNIADVNNPKEVSQYIIGDRGTESSILHDPHALLFDARNGLMVFPILEARILPEKYPRGVPPEAYGEYVFQGAYVLHIDATKGITLKGTLTHIDDPEIFLKSGYMYSSNEILRSLYIGETLYTISTEKIKANNIDTLKEIATINLAQ